MDQVVCVKGLRHPVVIVAQLCRLESLSSVVGSAHLLISYQAGHLFTTELPSYHIWLNVNRLYGDGTDQNDTEAVM